MLPSQTSTFQTIFTFDDQHPQQFGYLPSGGLIQARDGKLYGVTDEGGTNSYGTVFRITPSGALTTLGSFVTGPGARFPYGSLLQASDGNFYGTASASGVGGIFKLTQAGALSTFLIFDGYNGENPIGGLVQGKDGNLYGTASQGGTNANWVFGLVYQVSLEGKLKMVVQFSGNGGPSTGASPYAGLTVGTDGNLYGTTGTRGSRGNGNVFRIIMPGSIPTLKRESSTTSSQLILSWPTNYSNFTLQSSTSLSPPNWVDLTNPPAISGGQFFVTNPISSGAQFFRLRK